MLNQLKDIWTAGSKHPRVLLALFGIFAMVFAIDFIGRVFVARDSSARSFRAPSMPIVLSRPDPVVTKQLIDSWFQPPEEKPKEPPPRDIILEAVFGIPGKLKAAVVLKGEGQPIERLVLVQGDRVEGWLLESLEPRRLLLKKGEESRELVLFRVK
jgi:hypothetical protein